MKRTHIYFHTEILERLKAASADTGMPMAEIIRRGTDLILQRIEKPDFWMRLKKNDPTR